MRLLITRETDGATLEVVSGAWAPYVLHPDTVIAQSPALDFSGYEYSGIDGGYSIASRYQRRPLDLKLTVMEHWSNPKGLFELAAEARAFFDAHHDDLSVILYTIDFYSCDKVHSTFQLRHGAITVPFGIKANRNESTGAAQVSFIFEDPYIYWSGDNGVGITRFRLLPEDATGVIYGREWEAGSMAVWIDGGFKSWTWPADGIVPGVPVTVMVTSEATVPAEIEIEGRLVNPTITNKSNGSLFSYFGAIAAGTTLTVSSIGEVLLDGSVPPGTWYGQLTAGGGLNTFSLDADSGAGQANITIRGAL